ncbi:MAG: hypothetical protein JOZ18_09390 [Chloroflexi bacterium]|nr:hypothetical protein [Chloroflexota bacterium]
MEKKSEHRYASVKDFLVGLGIFTPLKGRITRQYEAATPSLPRLSLYRADTTATTRAARPETERIAGISQHSQAALPVSLTASTQQYKDYKKPVLTSLPIKSTNPTTDITITTKVPLPSSSPIRVSERRSGNSFSRQMWFILVSLLVVIAIIGFALLGFVRPSSLSLKPAPSVVSRNLFPTPTLTLMPTRGPMATPTHASASKLASIPTPTPFPFPSPTAMPTPAPTPAPALMVTPTSLHAETGCQKSGLYYICRVTLLLPQNYPNNIKWYGSAGNLSAFFSPAKGSLSPGQQQQVSVQILTACPHTGTLNFLSKNTDATVPWAC